MTDTEMFTLILAILGDGFAARNVTGVTFAQSYQPTQQGTPSGRAVYVHKLFDRPFGHPARSSRWDADAGLMLDTETQTYQVSFQVDATAPQDPSDAAPLTASDILKVARQVLQSLATIARLREAGAAILRVNELRNPPFMDERSRYEFQPSFDFMLTYDEVVTIEGAVVETVEYNIHRV